jgi:hypothetical protein
VTEPPKARSPIRSAYLLCAWGYGLFGVGVLLAVYGAAGASGEGGLADAALIFGPYVMLSGVVAALLATVTAAAGWVKDRRPSPWAIPTALGLLLPALFALYLAFLR